MSGPRGRRVDLITPPFSGHLHPLLGIGRRLVRDDLQVRVISTESARARIVSSGLDPCVILAGCDDAVQAIAEPPEVVGSNPFRLNAQFRATLALLGRMRDELIALYRIDPPQLAIVDFTLPLAGIVAREAGVPWWTSMPSPSVVETADGPPPYLGGLLPRADLVGRVRDATGRALIRGFKRTVARWHRPSLRALGLPDVYRADGTEAAYSPECILALGLRELEFAREWPRTVRFVGPVRYTPPGLAPLPPYAPGRRHVLITLGTHLRRHKDRVADAAQEAARALPHLELHFSDGRVQADQAPCPPDKTRRAPTNFHRLRFVDYNLLSRYDLIVHHAGAGILHETIAAGLPAIVLPLDYDQFDNAARLQAAGLATRLRSLTDLPRAIEQTLSAPPPDARARYRALLHTDPAENRIATLVHAQLATSSPGDRPPEGLSARQP